MQMSAKVSYTPMMPKASFTREKSGFLQRKFAPHPLASGELAKPNSIAAGFGHELGKVQVERRLLAHVVQQSKDNKLQRIQRQASRRLDYFGTSKGMLRERSQGRIELGHEEGESNLPDISNWGIGTLNNKTNKDFLGNASCGKGGESQEATFTPGKWGMKGKGLPSCPVGKTDIDFVFPTKKTPINNATKGAFKIGSNDATIEPDTEDQSNSKIDDFEGYWPHEKSTGLKGYPTQ
jgi:hypothetical protein